MTLKRPLLLGIALSIITTASSAADLKPKDAIKYRKAGYSFMSWNMKKIKAILASDADTFDTRQVAAAANAIAAIANSGMGALYIPGSETTIDNQTTRVKPELFTDKAGVKKVAVAFIQAANALAEAAASGDRVAIAQAYKRTQDSCKACHDKYRKD